MPKVLRGQHQKKKAVQDIVRLPSDKIFKFVGPLHFQLQKDNQTIKFLLIFSQFLIYYYYCV